MALLSCFENGFLHRVALEEAVELGRVAPGAAVIVVLECAGGEVADAGVEPSWEPHEQPGRLGLEEFHGAVRRLGEPEPAAEPPAEGDSEDVLEEKPDFLEETPEGEDDLWFEKKPPKDFDFEDD